MNTRGEDSPTVDDIEYFGLYDACKNTRGNFAVFKNGEYAAKGRTGSSPLYWNRTNCVFSFSPDDDLEEFPDGHLYNVKCDRLVCWESMYFDKPLKTRTNDAIVKITGLLGDAVRFRASKTDALLLSAGCGSRLIDKFLEGDEPSYTVAFSPGTCFDVDKISRENRTILYFDETTEYPDGLDLDEASMYVLARFLKKTTNHRKFLCGLGCTELFNPSIDYRPYVSHVVDQFAKFGLELYSPFFDTHLMEYVLDMTDPNDRPRILRALLGDYEEYGHAIYETVGARPSNWEASLKKKKWWHYW